MRRHVTSTWAALLVCTVGIVAEEAAKRLPVPSDADQEEAAALIKDVFKVEYAKRGADDQIELARTLYRHAVETEGLPASRFMLLREAIDISSRHGDVDTALQAVRSLIDEFAVDGPEVKMDALSKLALGASAPEQFTTIAESGIELTDEFAANDDFEGAIRTLLMAERAAQRARSFSTVATIRQKRKDVLEARQRFAAVASAAEKLEASPDDPEANLVMGRYACFVKGDWETGLARLAKGSDEKLKALAAAELAGPEDARARFKVANDWWLVADDYGGAERDLVRAHSADWYEQALPDLTGLHEAVAKKRIGEAEQAASQANLPTPRGRRRINLIPLIDPDQDAVHGKWTIEKGELVCHTGSFVPRIRIPYEPPNEYDFLMIVSQPRIRNPVALIMPKDLVFHAGGRRGMCRFTVTPTEGVKDTAHTTIDGFEPDKPYTLLVQMRRSGIKGFINGKLVLSFDPDDYNIKPSGWHDLKDKTVLGVSCDDPATFHRVELIEISGRGKKTR